jgi:hypothetical protein
MGLTNGRTYRCTARATNSFGTGPPSPPSAAVVPAGDPNPPVIVPADPGDGAATVNFAPQNNNGATITSYDATCTSSDGGAPGTGTDSKSGIVVTGLTNGNIYTCSVNATNAIGTSTESDASPAFIVGAPVHPTIQALVPTNANQTTGGFHIALAPGASNGSAITSYSATCAPVTTGDVHSSTGTGTQVFVSGLATAKTYSCTVAATNARGTSRDSAAVTAIVGAPGPPRITKVAQLSHGLAFAFLGAASNGQPVIDYRARCTSSNGGVAQSPLQSASPIVANHLSIGKSYQCTITARNSRGEGSPSTVGPVVVTPPHGSNMASCSGTSGSVKIKPGMAQTTAQTHSLDLDATLGTCTGPYVSAARVSLSLRTKRAASCGSASGLISSGFGTLRWTAPVGMGRSAASIHLQITSTGDHQTKATFFGIVTARNNVFSDAHVQGSLTLGRGFHFDSAGGDCSSQTPLTTMPVRAITMVLS